MKKLLFFLGHPAHFHLFRFIIPALEKQGHQVKVLIRTKDMLEDLCFAENLTYQNILPEKRGNSYVSIAISYLKKYKRISAVIRAFKPDLLLGSEPSLAHLGKIYRIPSFIFSEDDASIIPQFAKIAYPFVTQIISPVSCNAGKWEYKKISYNGYHKLAYLHPSVFKPDYNRIQHLGNEPYFILRFAQLTAYHDTNRGGINKAIAMRLISILKPFGKIYISSERPLEQELEHYRLPINPLDIHHAMFFAALYIGDSQSMAVEAALLGTPGIRFNDFAGEIGVLNELEEKYQLTKSFKTNNLSGMEAYLTDSLKNKHLKEETLTRKKLMLAEKINVFEFFIWLISTYPQSAEILKNNPQHSLNFQ